MSEISPRQPFVVILMGSPSDRPHCAEIASALANFGIASIQRIASAHKTPRRLVEILKEYEDDPTPHVYITVAGRSNALSGFVDAAVSVPVIACPPLSTAFGGADVFSSLRMPSGVAPLLVLEPANAALAAAKILSLAIPALGGRVSTYQAGNALALEEADREINASISPNK